jgi:spatacsin
MLDEEVRSVVKSHNILTEQHLVDPLQVIVQISDVSSFLKLDSLFYTNMLVY